MRPIDYHELFGLAVIGMITVMVILGAGILWLGFHTYLAFKLYLGF